MTEELDLFPLSSVLFPHQVIPMNIFEKRYLDMIQNCYQQQKSFGIALIQEGDEVGAPAIPYKIGTSAKIKSLDKIPHNRLFIVVEGERRFRILRLLQELPHIRVEIEWLDESNDLYPGDYLELRESLENLVSRMYLDSKAKNTFVIPNKDEEVIGVAATIINNFPLQKQEILESPPSQIIRDLTQFINMLGPAE